ncbi:MAG: hypothetical protein HJJLKODD_01252 [Phycisphaerae bacterium]|nr:hypothetical protein [Phycisphaerae bacterium]
MKRKLTGAAILPGLHILLLIMAGSIPLILMLQTVRQNGHWSLEPWREFVERLPDWQLVFERSLKLTGLSLLIALPVSTLLALLISRMRWLGRPILQLLVLLLVCTPSFLLTSALLVWISVQQCYESTPAAGLIHGLLLIPLMTLLITVGFSRLDPLPELAASLDLKPWLIIRHFTLPRSSRFILTAALLGGLLVITDYSVTDILAVRTFAEVMLTEYLLKGIQATPFLVALPLVVVMGGVLLTGRRLVHGSSLTHYQGAAHHPEMLTSSQAGSISGWLCSVAILAAVALLLQRLFQQTGGWQAAWETTRVFGREWFNSGLISLITAFIVAFFSLGLAWMLTRSRWPRYAVGAVTLLLLATPAPALALTIVATLNHPTPQWLMLLMPGDFDPLGWLYSGPKVIILGLVIRFLPVGILLLWPAVQRVPQALEDSARCDGAATSALWRHLYWPLCRTTMVMVGLIILIFCFSELNVTYLLRQPGYETLSTSFWGFVHTGMTREVGACCLATLISVLPPAAGLFLLLRRRLFVA